MITNGNYEVNARKFAEDRKMPMRANVPLAPRSCCFHNVRRTLYAADMLPRICGKHGQPVAESERKVLLAATAKWTWMG